MEETWSQIATNYCKKRRDHVHGVTGTQTGYSEEVLDELWAGARQHFSMCYYDGAWRQRTRMKWRSKHYFYIFLMYIHTYPPTDNCVDTLRTQRIPGLDYSTFMRNIMPLARNWNEVIDHIRWDDRLDPMNHHPLFPHFVTCLWDTTCIRVQKPKDWTFGRYVVNGHYDFPCFLVMTAVTMTGQLVYGSGLMRSTAYDAHIYFDTVHEHPQHSWELNIGDGHFSTCPAFFTPIKNQQGQVLTPQEVTWNEWLQLVRSRVEHVNTVIKNHRMFKGEPFRGYIRNLKVFVNVSLHGAAAQLRADELGMGARYTGYGPWAHDP